MNTQLTMELNFSDVDDQCMNEYRKSIKWFKKNNPAAFEILLN